jgi:hypothetical protein
MGAAPQISPARGSGGKKHARTSVTGVRAFFVFDSEVIDSLPYHPLYKR